MYWKNPEGYPQYPKAQVARKKFRFTTNRPWTGQFRLQNERDVHRKKVFLEPVGEWSFFRLSTNASNATCTKYLNRNEIQDTFYNLLMKQKLSLLISYNSGVVFIYDFFKLSFTYPDVCFVL